MASSASISSSSSTLFKSRTSHLHSSSSFLTFKSKIPIKMPLLIKPLRAVRAEFDMSFFATDLGAPPPIEGFADLDSKEEPECPPGLRQYETMAILRPNISEDERLAFIDKYQQLLSAGGAMHVEFLNKGVRPLAYSIKKKNKAGETNIYLDSIQILVTFFTKPDSVSIIGETLQRDDDVIRSSTFKIRKRKY
ncbi:hypothetical protein SASPL_117933 [Salvia splendens]|uniref:Small subunit ribosomal protein S6 n=1 Tax=Salvia splendens TaxID=180675 RepID=A0A8X8ZWS5_SALSN|nr:30S ribosomal protein S6 alpha, chloroplastic-like [Salvia splendens]KAG6421382.1 hypothetical protein SASPL_117933 [Salvia splendens]